EYTAGRCHVPVRPVGGRMAHTGNTDGRIVRQTGVGGEAGPGEGRLPAAGDCASWSGCGTGVFRATNSPPVRSHGDPAGTCSGICPPARRGDVGFAHAARGGAAVTAVSRAANPFGRN